MSFKSTVYPSRPAELRAGQIVMPEKETVQKNSGGVPAPFNRILDGEAQIDKHPVPLPMQQSVWVMRSIKLISDPICSVPLEFLTGPKKKSVPYENLALEAFWETPAVGMDYEQFVEACVGWWKLKGEFFWILDDTWFTRTANKSKLIVPRPDGMREIVDSGELVGWNWTDPNGKSYKLIPEQVIQVKAWNPYSQWRGLAEYLAAKIATESDYLQGKQVANLARNNGDQGAYVIAKGNMPTDDQQRQIASQLRMKRQAALKGDLRPIFLAGDITVQSPEIQSPDADFVAVRLENRHEIAIAFGVPPSMFDVMASYSVGSASDWYRLIIDTCITTARKLTGSIENVSKMLVGVDKDFPLRAKHNFDAHPVMQAARRERFASAVQLFGTGMPMKTAGEVLDLNLSRFAGDDIGYIPFNLTPVTGLVDPVNDPSLAEPKPADSPEQAEESDPVAQLSRAFASRAKGKSEDAKVRLWKKHMAARQPSVKNYRDKFGKVLMSARAQVLAKLASHHATTGKSIEIKAGAASVFMFDLHDFASQFKASMEKAGRSAYDDAGEQLYEEIGKQKDDPWVSPPAKVKAFIATRENKLKNVPQEVFSTIQDELTEGIENGESIKDLSTRVRSTCNEIDNGRGKTIAITETAAAYGTARQDAMEVAGIEYKEWLTSGNSNVRPAHAEAQGQIRQVGDPYDVDGEEIDYPGDPDGSAENVINCHCVSLPRVAPDEEKEES